MRCKQKNYTFWYWNDGFSFYMLHTKHVNRNRSSCMQMSGLVVQACCLRLVHTQFQCCMCVQRHLKVRDVFEFAQLDCLVRNLDFSSINSVIHTESVCYTCCVCTNICLFNPFLLHLLFSSYLSLSLSLFLSFYLSFFSLVTLLCRQVWQIF